VPVRNGRVPTPVESTAAAAAADGGGGGGSADADDVRVVARSITLVAADPPTAVQPSTATSRQRVPVSSPA